MIIYFLKFTKNVTTEVASIIYPNNNIAHFILFTEYQSKSSITDILVVCPILGLFLTIFIFSVTNIILECIFYLQEAFRIILKNLNIKTHNFLEPILEYVNRKIRRPLYQCAKNCPIPMANTGHKKLTSSNKSISITILLFTTN